MTAMTISHPSAAFQARQPVTNEADGISVPATRPKSAVSSGVGLAGFFGMTLWVMIARNWPDIAMTLGLPGPYEKLDGPNSALMCVFFSGVPMVLWSVLVDKVHMRPSTGIDWKNPRPIAEILDMSMTKLAGLWATWGGIAILYGLMRFYWQDPYLFAMNVFSTIAPALFLLSIPYVIWLDRYLVEPRDHAWHFGAMLIGRETYCREEVAHHLRAWAVKGFFMAFMLSIVPGGFGEVVRVDVASVLGNPVWVAQWGMAFLFLIDVHLATVGYLLTMRPLDAHIRTANPYLAGWLAALICYPPLILMNAGGPLDYHAGGGSWEYWFQGHDGLMWTWCALMLVLTAIYAWATMAFGIRFSNLTHRGVLTHGPYRFTKHPAYLSKNAFWWLGTMPFLAASGSATDAVRNTALLAMVSLVYYWRARTEEQHMMADPDYQAYAAWANAHAPVPRFFHWLASLRGRPANS